MEKKYIGQSIDILKRWCEHKYKAECPVDISYNSAIHMAFRKYGLENFKFEIIKECDQDELDDEEKKFILIENTITPNGYNILGGGQKDKGKITIDYSGTGFVIKKLNKKCILCGKELNRHTKGDLCFQCYNKTRIRRVVDFKKLMKRIYEMDSMTGVGRELNVSFCSVKKMV